MMVGLGISFNGASSCRLLEWVSKAGSKRHRIAHRITSHGQGGLVGHSGGKVE